MTAIPAAASVAFFVLLTRGQSRQSSRMANVRVNIFLSYPYLYHTLNHDSSLTSHSALHSRHFGDLSWPLYRVVFILIIVTITTITKTKPHFMLPKPFLAENMRMSSMKNDCSLLLKLCLSFSLALVLRNAMNHALVPSFPRFCHFLSPRTEQNTRTKDAFNQ